MRSTYLVFRVGSARTLMGKDAPPTMGGCVGGLYLTVEAHTMKVPTIRSDPTPEEEQDFLTRQRAAEAHFGEYTSGAEPVGSRYWAHLCWWLWHLLLPTLSMSIASWNETARGNPTNYQHPHQPCRLNPRCQAAADRPRRSPRTPSSLAPTPSPNT